MKLQGRKRAHRRRYFKPCSAKCIQSNVFRCHTFAPPFAPWRFCWSYPPSLLDSQAHFLSSSAKASREWTQHWDGFVQRISGCSRPQRIRVSRLSTSVEHQRQRFFAAEAECLCNIVRAVTAARITKSRVHRHHRGQRVATVKQSSERDRPSRRARIESHPLSMTFAGIDRSDSFVWPVSNRTPENLDTTLER